MEETENSQIVAQKKMLYHKIIYIYIRNATHLKKKNPGDDKIYKIKQGKKTKGEKFRLKESKGGVKRTLPPAQNPQRNHRSRE